MTAFRVFFGGPDRPPRLLRNVLEERVDAVPAGGEILWVTYYFRDEALAEALIRAKHRGVTVRVAVEAIPRTRSANRDVQKKLQENDALGAGCRVVAHYLPNNFKGKRPYLHEKLYYFSHPQPVALVGSFNPSGNIPEDPEVIREIGDQDRGHNGLVEIQDPGLVDGLMAHARWIFGSRHVFFERWTATLNREIHTPVAHIYFFPRRHNKVVTDLLASLEPGAHVRIAASHVQDPLILETLLRIAERGVNLAILAHDTWRRVPLEVEQALSNDRIQFRRYVHPEGLPMHNKFILIESRSRKHVLLGSLNLTVTSRYANHEILVLSEDDSLHRAFAERWESMQAERSSDSLECDPVS